MSLLKYPVRFVWLLLGCCACPSLTAQPGLSAFVHYTTDQGLSNDFINDIVKDRLGFLWVATLNGLNRFDGHSFRQFYQKDGLTENFVKNITLAPDGSLWTNSNKGICRIDPVTLEFRQFILPENKDTLENDMYGKVVFDPNGKGWVNGEYAMHHFDPAAGDVVSYPIELRSAGYFDTYLDRTGKIWMIDRSIISYFDTQTKKLKIFETEKPGHPAAGAALMYVREDQRGKVWIGSWFKGLLWYDPTLDSIFDYPDKNTLASIIQPDAFEAGKPFLWLGGGHHGLYIFNPETEEDIQFPPDPRDPFTHNNYLASSLYKDESDGSLWIGTEAGLEHYAPTALRFGRAILPVDNRFGQFSLMSDAIQDKTDPTGNTFYISMWGSGIFKWDRKNNIFEQFHKGNSGLRDDGIFCMVQDGNGYIWAGTTGVSRLDPRSGKWSYWKAFSKKFNANTVIMSCIEDKDGGLWFGSNFGGLFRYNPSVDRVEEVPLPPEACNPDGRLRIRNMSLDKQGRIWLATSRQPIRLDPKTRKPEIFQVKNIDSKFNVWSDVLVARNGLIYVTSHDCILELDSTCTVLRKFNQDTGMRTNSPYFIEEDQQGRIWSNTTHLLHCLDPVSGQFSFYGTADGLFKNTMTDGLVRLPNGEIFVGFQNAFNYFHPARLRRNVTPPPVVITSMKVMDRERKPIVRKFFRFSGLFSKMESVQVDTLLLIQPGEDIFTIEFAALNFNQPERNRYAYKLEGFKDDWVYTDLNFATYTNLDGGEYTFRVKAANNDGIWNEAGTHILVKVVPPVARRWYFKFFLAGLGGLIFMAVWQYRRQQRRRLEAFRERLARDLHDEMGSTLSSIRFFSDFAKQQVSTEKQEVVSILQRISQSASDLSDSMQDIIWAMKTRNDQLEDLAAHMTEFGLRLFESKNVTFTTHIGEGFSGKSLKPELRRNIYLIFKEAVNNAAKYAEATQVELFLSLKKGLLLMRISDNGKGFDPDNPSVEGGGNGLLNMRMRAEEIGGRLEIVSKNGEGTSVVVRVKV